VKPLKFFHDDYGLKPKDGDEETDGEDEFEESDFTSDEDAYSHSDDPEDDKLEEA
jgi:hypothetical protein